MRGAYRGYKRGVGYIQPPDCIPAFPGAIPDPACIALQAQIQQENMAEHDEEQRQIFLADCNQNWETNDAQYEALGLPRPVNNCALIYPVNLRGEANPVPIPVTYMPAAPPAQAPAPAPAPASAPAPNTPAPSGSTAPKDSTAPPANRDGDPFAGLEWLNKTNLTIAGLLIAGFVVWKVASR